MKKIDLSKTNSSVIFIFIIFFLIFKKDVFIYIILFFTFGNIFKNPINDFITDCWLKLIASMGKFNSTVILLFLYYLILTPTALLYKIFNKKSVEHFKINNKESIFNDLNHNYHKELFNKKW